MAYLWQVRNGKRRTTYILTNSQLGERVKQDQDRPTRKDRENQIVKPALNSTNVGEYVMKAPIAGVVRETPAAPLARILMQYGV